MKILFTPKDSASSLLTAGISAVALSIPVTTGTGALFPQPYNGTATSGGTATTLNSTGISAAIGGSAAIGKFIYNATDGSWAKITAVSTNSITTTRLNDGTDNLWDNADKWYIDPFILTLAVVSTNAYGVKTVTASEKALIIGRSTDTFTVATGGRGYDGSTAQSFSLGDSVYLNVNKATIENIQEVILSTQTQIDTNLTALNALTTRVSALETGAYDYVVATGSANAYVLATPAFNAYAAGNKIRFKANFTNSGSATVNVNGLGAKTLKKTDGATNLASGDIVNGQIVECSYNGTDFQLTSPIGQSSATQVYEKVVWMNATDSGSTNNGGTFSVHQYTIPAGDLVNGVAYVIEGSFSLSALSGGFSPLLYLGGVQVGQLNPVGGTSAQSGAYRATLYGTAAAGASVAVRCEEFLNFFNNGVSGSYKTTNVATNGDLAITIVANAGTSCTVVWRTSKIMKISTSLFS